VSSQDLRHRDDPTRASRPGARVGRGPYAPRDPASASVSAAASLAAAALLVLAFPGPAAAQNVTARTIDAQIPRSGELWIEVAPTFQGWDERFGGDGSRHPLASDYSGPLASLLYPGPEAAAQDLNADAAALGYDPVPPGQTSLGAVDMSELNREIRAVPLRIEFGFLGRFSVEASVPAVWTKAEPFLAFDSAGATVAAGSSLPDRVSFFSELDVAMQGLQDRIDAGDLSASQEAQARALLDASSAFLDALRRRALTDDLIPLAATPAGQQMLAYWAGLQGGFGDFGVSAPSLSLPGTATSQDLAGYFGGAFLQGQPLTATVRSWTAGELEAGLRIGLLDGFADDSARSGFRLRTTIGVLGRFPVRSSDALLFYVAGDFLGVPVGDGQRDVELTLYQDFRLGGWLELDARGSYGLQMSDRMEVRPHPPSRPFPVPSVTQEVVRDPGDYVRVRVAPRLSLAEHTYVGLEYRYWHKWADAYATPGGGTDPTVSTLISGTGQTWHRLGVGVTYRPGGPDSQGEVGFIYQTVIAGRGRLTPASGLTTFHIRIPARVF